MKYCLSGLLTLLALYGTALCCLAGDFVSPQSPVAKYRIKNWEEKRGNHRAVVHVDKPAKALRVRIPWRRRDKSPEKKKIIVYAPDGKTVIANARPSVVTQEYGDIIFEATSSGDYTVYYLPCIPWIKWSDKAGKYIPADYSKAKAWAEREGLNDKNTIAKLPTAECVAIEARGEFNRFDPMEVPATPAELKLMKQKLVPGKDYMVFAEDRKVPIKMLDAVPVRWLRSGPANRFSGTAQPGEIYPFQLAVWAPDKPLTVDLAYSDLKSDDGSVIPASVFECINIDITEFSGKKRHRPVKVKAKAVQPLWILVKVPLKTLPGVYHGICTVKVSGMESSKIALELKVAGKPLPDGGVSDNWRLSRLAWLNSTVGYNDTVLPPYLPIKLDGNTLKLLNREIKFDSTGMPCSIRVKGKEILAAPASFTVKIGRKILVFSSGKSKIIKTGKDCVVRETTGTSPKASYRLTTTIESDGMIAYNLELTALKKLKLNDVLVSIPVRRKSAKYLMGLGVRGGLRKRDVKWKWNPGNATNYIWLGNYDRGIQLHLMPGNDEWEAMSVTPSPEWNNKGKGGINVIDSKNAVIIYAYSGARKLAAGKKLTFRYRISVTPFREQTAARWNWRFHGWGTDGASNIETVFHGTRGNPHINYPFTELNKELGEEIDKINNRVTCGTISYPLKGLVSIERGSVELEFRLNFDPDKIKDAIALPFLNFKDHSAFGVSWIPAAHGVRLILIKHTPSFTSFPFELFKTNLNWKKGETHRIGFSWGNGKTSIWADGVKCAEANLNLSKYFSRKHFDAGDVAFTGAVHVKSIRIGNRQFTGDSGKELGPKNGFFFDPIGSGKPTDRKVNIRVEGGFRFEDGYLCLDGKKKSKTQSNEHNRATVYYTVREMSAIAPELWAFRSLQDEIYSSSAFIYSGEGAWIAPAAGGDPWLQEHLVSAYAPAWKIKTYSGEKDISLGLKAPTRWHNYYLAGVDYLSRRFKINGIYLDSFGAGRETAKRLRKVLYANNPREGHLWWHAGNNYDFMNNHSSIYSTNMEAMPFFSQAWNGEAVDFSHSPDYYLVELSGIPFGLPAEMLEHNTGGNQYHGIIYGMSGRIHPSARYMYHLWDKFDIANAEMIGYWTKKPPVIPSDSDIKATTYVHPGKRALIALSQWQDNAIKSASAGRRKGRIFIDGNLDDPGWKNALSLDRFTIFGSNKPANLPTSAAVTWDKHRLYISFRCKGQNPNKLLANAKIRDGKLWEDDSIEFFIRPDLNSDRYIQFIGNSKSVFFDSMNMKKWNGNWMYRAKTNPQGWQGEASITWKSLGVNGAKLKNGDKIGFNICRNQRSPFSVYFSWGGGAVSPHNLRSFGSLKLAAMAKAPKLATSKPSAILKIDWQRLGLDPKKVSVSKPEIRNFQNGAKNVDISKAIEMNPNEGVILLLEVQND